MEFTNLSAEELIERRDSLVAAIDAEDADLDAIENEVRAIKEELEQRKETEARKSAIREEIAVKAGEVVETFENMEERKTMDMKEIRSSEAYINAFAEYIKSGDDKECRGIITENGGTVEGMTNIPVPTFVDDIVRTAWEKNEVLNRVKKTYFKGNLKVAYEASATGAQIHEEGGEAIDEEELVLGVVEMVPKTIKKWISISDEAIDMGGEALLRYVYDELTYRILQKLVSEIILAIASAGSPFVTTVPTEDISVTTIATLLSNLSPEAANPVAMMSRSTWAEFKEAAASANYAIDPFEGLPVIFLDLDDGIVIVGDLGGIHVNYPNGDDVKIKYDDITQAPADMVRIIGRQYVAFDVTAPKSFAVRTGE